MARLHPRRRRGFTLVELMVTTLIILILAGIAAPVALSLLNGRTLREATSNVQAALAGARDRAAAAGAPRGLRLIPDRNDPSLVGELRYIEQTHPVSTGKALVLPVTWNGDWNTFSTPFRSTTVRPIPTSPWAPTTTTPIPALNTEPLAVGQSFSLVAIKGIASERGRLLGLPFYLLTDGTTKVFYGSIRLATSGQTFAFTTTEAMLTANPDYCLLRLSAPLARPIPYDAGNGVVAFNDLRQAGQPDDFGDEYVIPVGNAELGGEEPISLPAGIAIDLGHVTRTTVPDPSRRLTLLQPEGGQWDIMFTPGGQVLGNAAANAHIFLWLRELAAATADLPDTTSSSGQRRMIPTTNSGNHAIVAVAARTGLVRGVEPNFGADPGYLLATTDPAYYPATFDSATGATTSGNGGPYWNPDAHYRLYFNALAAPEGGETGL